MLDSPSLKTKYYKESIRNNFIIGIFSLAIAVVSIFIFNWSWHVCVFPIVLGTYKIIIGSINYFSYSKAEKNFLGKKKG